MRQEALLSFVGTASFVCLGTSSLSFISFKATMSIYRIARALPFSGFFRQLEKEAETVISVLQPGPLGIIQHKFTPHEIRQAKATVCRAVVNWRRHSKLEYANGVLNHFIYK